MTTTTQSDIKLGRLDDALPGLIFDARSQRWRYKDSRQFASMQAVRFRAEKYRDKQQGHLITLAREYKKGSLTLREFQVRSATTIKNIHLAEMIRALDEQDNLDPEKFLIAAKRLKQQYHSGKDVLTGDRYGLKYLFEDLTQGLSQEKLEARLAMFGQSGKVTYWETKVNVAQDEFKEAKRVLSPVEHCGNCIEYARRGWGAIANAILPTQACKCRTNCKCSLEFR